MRTRRRRRSRRIGRSIAFCAGSRAPLMRTVARPRRDDPSRTPSESTEKSLVQATSIPPKTSASSGSASRKPSGNPSSNTFSSPRHAALIMFHVSSDPDSLANAHS